MIKETLKQLKKSNKKITMLTCYDYCTAKIIDGLIDLILVGDSMGMVVYGEKGTKQTNIQQMEDHIKAVARGTQKSHIIGDMTINTYSTPEEALTNASKLKLAGADSVKIEGNKPEIIKKLVNNNIPVMGHIGLLPQTAKKYCVKGKTTKEAEQLLKDAVDLERAGCYSIVLECIPLELAKTITKSVNIPTIGIGAGPYCDGQVLVINDMLGLFKDLNLKFVKQYVNINENITKAVKQYADDVKTGKFPLEEHSFK